MVIIPYHVMGKKGENPILIYNRRMARMLYAIDYLGRYCTVCGFDGFLAPWLIDFHHKNTETKEYEVKNTLYNGNFHTHKKELDKCELTCVSCHRNNHAKSEMYKQNIDDIMKRFEIIKDNGGGKVTKNYFLTLEDKDNILKLISDGLLMSEIAKELNLNYGTVKSFVKTQKLNPNKSRVKIKIAWSIVIKMLNAKHSIRNIAKKLNINRETLRQQIEKNITCTILAGGIKRYSKIS